MNEMNISSNTQINREKYVYMIRKNHEITRMPNPKYELGIKNTKLFIINHAAARCNCILK